MNTLKSMRAFTLSCIWILLSCMPAGMHDTKSCHHSGQRPTKSAWRSSKTVPSDRPTGRQPEVVFRLTGIPVCCTVYCLCTIQGLVHHHLVRCFRDTSCTKFDRSAIYHEQMPNNTILLLLLILFSSILCTVYSSHSYGGSCTIEILC